MQETAGTLVTYLQPPGDLDELIAHAEQRLRGLATDSKPDLTWRWQPHEEWEILWRRGLGPRRVTSRIVVTPSWESVETEPGEVLVTVDPGMAFGTAEHATTRGCLRLMDTRVFRGARIVDVGTGSGILAITAALLGAGEVLALDTDESACHVARENVVLNEVETRVRVLRAEVVPRARLPGGSYDGVLANLQTSLLLPLLPIFRESLGSDGWMILSGILQSEGAEVRAAAREGFLLESEDTEDEWWTGAFRVAGSPAGG